MFLSSLLGFPPNGMVAQSPLRFTIPRSLMGVKLLGRDPRIVALRILVRCAAFAGY